MAKRKPEEINQPSAQDAEENLLSALLMDPSLICEIDMAAENFYLFPNRYIYEAILSIHAQGKEPDIVTLKDELTKQGKYNEAGGTTRLTQLIDKFSMITHENIKHYVSIIEDKAVRRKIINLSREIAFNAYENHEIGQIASLIDDLRVAALAGGKTKPYVWLSELIPECIARIEEMSKGNTDMTGLKTGFYDLDAIIGGLKKGNLVIVAGRPSHGKTSFATNIAVNIASVSRPVIMYSIESCKAEIGERIIAQESKIDAQRIVNRKLTPLDWDQMRKACVELSREDKVCIYDISTASPYEILRVARTLKKDRGAVGAIIIDYLQLMTAGKKAENKTHEIADITRNLKAIAKEMECPVIILSQLSRAPENRTEKMPKLSDLRDSGAIEQDADIVIFIHRPEEKGTVAMVKVAKNRNGPTGTIELVFLRESFCFVNMRKGNDKSY